MPQPQEARIICRECNSFYASEIELWEHMREAHRRCVSESVPFQFQRGRAQPESRKNRFGTTKEEWADVSVHLRNHVQVHFKSEELDAIDRFILLASEASIFDDVCR
jgi:hypothetical protein